MMSKVICNVYRSTKKAGMYLYIDKQSGMQDVPDALLGMFGEPQLVMTTLLTAEKKLAGVSGEHMLAVMRDKGFYLQMPPQPDAEMQSVAQRNDKLYGP